MPAAKPPFQRFLAGYRACPDTGCWIWQGHRYPNGYGAIKAFGKMRLAHRFSFELHKGPIPDGLELLHSCDVKHCVNPDHLRPGTHAENMAEAAARGRMRSGVDHPLYGTTPKRPMQAIPVRVLGKDYESMNEAERELGLGSGTVSYWLKSHPQKAKKISQGKLS